MPKNQPLRKISWEIVVTHFTENGRVVRESVAAPSGRLLDPTKTPLHIQLIFLFSSWQCFIRHRALHANVTKTRQFPPCSVQQFNSQIDSLYNLSLIGFLSRRWHRLRHGKATSEAKKLHWTDLTLTSRVCTEISLNKTNYCTVKCWKAAAAADTTFIAADNNDFLISFGCSCLAYLDRLLPRRGSGGQTWWTGWRSHWAWRACLSPQILWSMQRKAGECSHTMSAALIWTERPSGNSGSPLTRTKPWTVRCHLAFDTLTSRPHDNSLGLTLKMQFVLLHGIICRETFSCVCLLLTVRQALYAAPQYSTRASEMVLWNLNSPELPEAWQYIASRPRTVNEVRCALMACRHKDSSRRVSHEAARGWGQVWGPPLPGMQWGWGRPHLTLCPGPQQHLPMAHGALLPPLSLFSHCILIWGCRRVRQEPACTSIVLVGCDPTAVDTATFPAPSIYMIPVQKHNFFERSWQEAHTSTPLLVESAHLQTPGGHVRLDISMQHERSVHSWEGCWVCRARTRAPFP